MKDPRYSKRAGAAADAAPRSMTGYGSARAERGAFVVEAEVRSVNHRYISVQMRCPSEWAAIEPEVDALIKSKIQRGSVTVQLQASKKNKDASSVLDEAQAKAAVQSLRKLAKSLKLKGEVKLEHVLAAPGVFAVARQPHAVDDELRAQVLEAVGGALDALAAARAREGAALAVELLGHVVAMRGFVSLVEARTPAVVAEYQTKLKRRLAELLAGTGASVRDEDLAREVALLADRTDVTEEIARLRVHLDEAEQLLRRGEPVGRRLEFLTQELLREVNTTGSKSADAEVTKHVIEMKAALERVREQVANLE